MSEKCKETCKYLNYVEHVLIVIWTVTICVSVSAFALLVCVLVGSTSSAIWTKNLQSLQELKCISQLSKKKKKKHDKKVLLGKTKLDAIDVLISKVLIVSYISHDKFVSKNKRI